VEKKKQRRNGVAELFKNVIGTDNTANGLSALWQHRRHLEHGQVQDLSGQGIAGASNAAPPSEVSGDGARAIRRHLSNTQTQGSIKI
jgi:hypothetical protein